MEHIDWDTLAQRALGEPVGAPAEEAHLQVCQTCQQELAALRRTAARVRELTPDDLAPPPPPPPHLWTEVEEELRASASAGPPGPARLPRRRPPLLVAASVALIAVLGLAAVLGVRAWRDDAELVAAAELAPLVDEAEPGTARLVRRNEGLYLVLEAEDLPPTDGYYELWLIDENVEGMVSLGPLVGPGPHPLPEGLDPQALPIVDISREPLDGDPTHSGDSVLRGTLVHSLSLLLEFRQNAGGTPEAIVDLSCPTSHTLADALTSPLDLPT